MFGYTNGLKLFWKVLMCMALCEVHVKVYWPLESMRWIWCKLLPPLCSFIIIFYPHISRPSCVTCCWSISVSFSTATYNTTMHALTPWLLLRPIVPIICFTVGRLVGHELSGVDDKMEQIGRNLIWDLTIPLSLNKCQLTYFLFYCH